MVWRAAQGWTVAWAILLLIQGILPAISVYLTRSAVNALVAALNSGTGWDRLQPVLIPLAMLAGVIIAGQLLQSASDWVRTIQAEYVQDYMSNVVHEKSTTVDLGYFDSPAFFDRLFRARSDASARPLALLENTGGLLQNAVTFLSMSAVLLQYGWWLPVFLLISTIPAFFVIIKDNERQHEWSQRTTPDRRRVAYLDMILTDRWAAEEVRLFKLGPHFREMYRALRRQLRLERLHLLKRQTAGRLVSELIALAVVASVMVWMVSRAVSGRATLGDVTLFYQAFERGQGLMRSLMANVSQLYTNMLFVENLFEFLGLESKVVDPAVPHPPIDKLQHSIVFKNVSFRYPGSERIALNDFNLSIPAGGTVAIVGPNGAGKSTLIKLLCRFHDPTSGSLEFDGIDARQFAVADVRKLITLLLQIPVPYHTTARENIALGDLESGAGIERIAAAAEAAGADEIISRLPKGYDTLLGTWFEGGTNLSSGEWQRVAMARAYLRNAQIIVLDEPTSFMDSWAEADWFQRLRGLAAGRTTVVITHRFTIAMRADNIYVMNEGEIVESGSHEQLLARGGLYAQSWAAQMEAADTARHVTAGS
jgi:ATP-binding cassette subfamily B protein